jgi:ribonucleoside-diphosphate reductase alpha chain
VSESNKDLALKNALEFFAGNELSATTYLNKYALKDKEGNYIEISPLQTIVRVMKVLADAMPEDKTVDAFYDPKGKPTCKLSRPEEKFLERIYKDEYPTKVLFSSTNGQFTWLQLFGEVCQDFTGVCPQGSVLAAAGNILFPQSVSNCFCIKSPEDSIAGIFKAGEEVAQLLKKRGGVGLDISTLRPSGAIVSNAARTSTGAVGWMNFFSDVCKDVGQGGRRGALMLTLHIKHPDALAFAQAKLDPEYCTGANISLRINSEFMEAVKNNRTFIQQWPIESDNPIITKEVNARELWKEIIRCAHAKAEPGILMWDTCINNLPANFYEEFQAVSTNPCGEIILSPYDSCRLTSICLTKYVENKFSKEAKFNYDRFEREIRIAMRMMDAIVTTEVNHIDLIINKIIEDKQEDKEIELNLWNTIKTAAIKGRRVGLGTHGLGDCLAQLCLKYDSKEALKKADKIYFTLRNIAYDESIEMAKDYGPFPIFNWEKEKECEFIKRLPEELKQKMQQYGRRNISILTNAPTGTISMLSQVSSGIEPTFRHMYVRRRKINSNDLESKVDFVDQSGDKWTEFPVFEKNIERYFKSQGMEIPKDIKKDEDLDKLLPSYFVTSDKIDWLKRVEMQATAQRYIDHSISSTINLPADVSVEEVAKIYEAAYEKGLKGVTVYRDGCRAGVLITKKEEDHPKQIVRSKAPQRPSKLPCEVHFTKVKGTDYVVICGILNGAVYEVFCGEYSNQIPKKQFSGYVERRKKGEYYLCFLDDEQLQFREIDINKYFDNEQYEATTRLLSMSLRHGVPLPYILEQLKKASKNLFEFGSAVSRVLKKYIDVEEMASFYKATYGDNVEVRMEDGCMKIINLDTGSVESKCD